MATKSDVCYEMMSKLADIRTRWGKLNEGLNIMSPNVPVGLLTQNDMLRSAIDEAIDTLAEMAKDERYEEA